MLTSIITTARNTPFIFLQQCADSIISQTSPLEWIVCDDASNRETACNLRELVATVRRKHKATYFRMPRRSWLSVSRNAAIERAKGDWIFVLDADDRWALCPSTFYSVWHAWKRQWYFSILYGSLEVRV